MSRIINDLKTIINRRDATRVGVVQESQGEAVKVVTDKGIVTVSSGGGIYPSGSAVRIDGGNILYRIRGRDTLPVYRV